MSEQWGRHVRPKFVKKFTPRIAEYSKPFWEGIKRGELLIQKCGDCGNTWYPPGPFCPKCLSKNVEWMKSNGQGFVGAFTTTYAASPSWTADLMPYTLAIIALHDIEVPIVSHVINCKPEDVYVGMEVQIVFDNPKSDFPLFRFEPISQTEE